MTTKFLSKEQALAERKWVLVDADGQTLGRLATKIAGILRGKNKASFTPHVDCGDFVVVLNAAKVKLTGNKLEKKKYHHHTLYPGGLKTETAGQALERHPDRLIHSAVKGMLPKGPLGRALQTKLKVYEGAEHPHIAQNPQAI